MIKKGLLILLLLIATALAQNFQSFVNRVNNTPSEQREAIVDSFVNKVGNFPYIENDTLAHFLYRGNANSVKIPGDANGWNPATFTMGRLSTTTLWYFSNVFESDARLDYKLVINGSNWILDSRNPYKCSGGFGPNSELRMPKYNPPQEIKYDPAIPHGSIKDSLVYSAVLKNSRTIKIYTPPGYHSTTQKYPLILVHDGSEYVTLAQANNTIDYLIAHNLIEPIIAIFVPPYSSSERSAEYTGDKQDFFTNFIINELVPTIMSHYRVESDPKKHMMMGASNGGNISLFISYYHPDVFGCVAAQSSYIQPSLVSAFSSGNRVDLKVYLDIGTYDISMLIPMVRNFMPVLAQKGYETKYLEFHEGHSWGNWKAHLDDILLFFFPSKSQGVEGKNEIPCSFELGQNYPNPFNLATTIPFTLDKEGIVHLQVFNSGGRIVSDLLNRHMKQGTHSVTFAATGLASGVYFYRLALASHLTYKSMLLLK